MLFSLAEFVTLFDQYTKSSVVLLYGLVVVPLVLSHCVYKLLSAVSNGHSLPLHVLSVVRTGLMNVVVLSV